MKIGPFICLPGRLVINDASMEQWELYSSKIFDMQKYVPWWIGDMMVYGRTLHGEEAYQGLPDDIDVEQCSRFEHIARKYPPEERHDNVSWAHHAAVLRIKNDNLRHALLQMAEDDRLDLPEFKELMKRYM